ncbi:DUF6538 domain-containing protein [Bradyrhizobium amphicarpaeae]|uniref:DUF6538 domain-containing protein n=1 Tax=Bradyrhizobium amphicarpaeae TaxID=1404768 RepID=UPI0039C85541
MAFHIFRRQAVYSWRRRTPRALAKVVGRQHLFMSLKTTNRAAARRSGGICRQERWLRRRLGTVGRQVSLMDLYAS